MVMGVVYEDGVVTFLIFLYNHSFVKVSYASS